MAYMVFISRYIASICLKAVKLTSWAEKMIDVIRHISLWMTL